MKIQYTSETPRKIKDYNEVDLKLGPKEVEDIAEIFNTPLTGTYNWDYTIQDNRIAKLYELGKKLNWNVSLDIDWDRPLVASDEIPAVFWDEYPPYKKLNDDEKGIFRHRGASQLSQFLHGEQGALLVASHWFLVHQLIKQSFMLLLRPLMRQGMWKHSVNIYKLEQSLCIQLVQV